MSLTDEASFTSDGMGSATGLSLRSTGGTVARPGGSGERVSTFRATREVFSLEIDKGATVAARALESDCDRACVVGSLYPWHT